MRGWVAFPSELTKIPESRRYQSAAADEELRGEGPAGELPAPSAHLHSDSGSVRLCFASCVCSLLSASRQKLINK